MVFFPPQVLRTDLTKFFLQLGVYRHFGDILEINFKWIWGRNQEEDYLKYVASVLAFAIHFLELLSQEYNKSLKCKQM